MSNGQQVKYILLVRHASRAVRWDRPDELHAMKHWSHASYRNLRKSPISPDSDSSKLVSQDPPNTKISDFTTPGFNRTVAIAGYLSDLLQNHLKCDKVKIFHGDHLVTQQTAKIYGRLLARDQLLDEGDREAVQAVEWLNPKPKDACTSCHVNEIKQNGGAKAIILIGHQPALTRIAHHILKPNKLPANTLPLGGSEAACFHVSGDPRLCWMLTERSEDDLKELKEKIRSKYDVAKFFLGAFVVNTGLILSTNIWSVKLWPNRLMAYLAVLSGAIALVLTAATLFSYDELLMPSAFWGEEPESGGGWWTQLRRKLKGSPRPRWNVERPPCQEHIVIFYEMVHIWQNFFTPAILAAFASVGFFVMAIAYERPIILPDEWFVSGRISLEGAILFILAILSMVFLFFVYERKRPKLGVSD